MIESNSATLDRLSGILQLMPRVIVAVSGGIDSLTLMQAAHRVLGSAAEAVHATSPAVPSAARRRLKDIAACHGWRLTEVDAGELADPNYLTNPINRCFFCKSHLYETLAALARNRQTLILSGTNLDDLSDFRPGLQAAEMHGVRHPFVEAQIDKTGVRSLAKQLNLGEFAELPASPCLASRVETGFAISPSTLQAIDLIEEAVRTRLEEPIVRCRIRPHHCDIELGSETAMLRAANDDKLLDEIGSILTAAGLGALRVRQNLYKRGSAFVQVADIRGATAGEA